MKRTKAEISAVMKRITKGAECLCCPTDSSGAHKTLLALRRLKLVDADEVQGALEAVMWAFGLTEVEPCNGDDVEG